MKELKFNIETLSPMHLGDGKSDVIIDAEIVHDKYGMPYFPAKRLKGLLYESAIEMAEISQENWFSIEDVNKVFGQKDALAASFILENLYLPNYEKLVQEWGYLQNKYNRIFTSRALLESYTQLRYQTSIDEKTGTTKDGSLHNIRVLDENNIFSGSLIIIDNEELVTKILDKAVPNLRYAGAKRNRGLGHIKCSITEVGRDKK